ncbi:MAG TPA: histidine phosphatase family protein [Caulobacteraceae bacterium]|jgi:broad specificity phosphatase PhoE|nr:histidine phosphatase family protein [Caulobacteraceae bacterium]
MGRVILVKHALPVLSADVPSNRWVLSAAGQESCRALAAGLRGQGVRRLYASLEPKALETAARVAVELGLDVRPRVDLHENDRTDLGFPPLTDLERLIERFFDEPEALVMGRETASAALARFAAAVRAIADESEDAPAAIVAHGTVITLFLAQHAGVEPFALWKEFGLACFVVLEGQDLSWDGVIRRPSS